MHLLLHRNPVHNILFPLNYFIILFLQSFLSFYISKISSSTTLLESAHKRTRLSLAPPVPRRSAIISIFLRLHKKGSQNNWLYCHLPCHHERQGKIALLCCFLTNFFHLNYIRKSIKIYKICEAQRIARFVNNLSNQFYFKTHC